MTRQHSTLDVGTQRSDIDDDDDSFLRQQQQQRDRRLLRRKLISLSGSVIVALSAGSNYAFSSFAPQLQEALHLTSIQINLIGIAGNAGVYLSSPLWGSFIDKRGPKIAMFTGAIIVPIGYAGLSYAYRRRSVDTPTTLLVLLNLLVGLGNSGSFTAAMNAQAKSWGGTTRGTATALVLSGFGLSAFFYSTLSHALFADNTSDYLLLLAFGSMASMLTGLAIVRPFPTQDHHQHYHGDQARRSRSRSNSDALEIPHSRTRRRTSSEIGARTAIWNETNSVDSACSDECEPAIARNGSRNGDIDAHAIDDSDHEAAAGTATSERQSLLTGRTEPTKTEDAAPDAIDISGRQLLRQVDFLLLFCVMALVSGAGLLLINNVGTITKTLWDFNHRSTPELLFDRRRGLDGPLSATALASLRLTTKAAVQKLQAQQVSAISLCNASGRIIIGLLSDFLVNRTGSATQRVWLLIVVTMLAFLSQLLAALPGTVETVHQLLFVSALTGLSYGTLFGLCPVLMFEWFGMKHFSQNYGFLSLSPVLAGNIFNLLFGRIYDSHVDPPQRGAQLNARMMLDGGLGVQLREVHGARSGGGGGGHHFCLDGPECYRQVFAITTVGSVVAIAASVVLIARRAGGGAGLAGLLRGGGDGVSA